MLFAAEAGEITPFARKPTSRVNGTRILSKSFSHPQTITISSFLVTEDSLPSTQVLDATPATPPPRATVGKHQSPARWQDNAALYSELPRWYAGDPVADERSPTPTAMNVDSDDGGRGDASEDGRSSALTYSEPPPSYQS